MSDRVSIGTRYNETLFILAVAGAIIAAVVGLLLVGFQLVTGGAAVLGFAAVCVVLAAARGFHIARGRRWITPTDFGFVLEDRRGEFEFTDDQITDLGTWSKVRYSNGQPKAIVRKGSMVLKDRDFAGRLAFAYEFPLNRPDPLDEFLDRVLTRLTDEAAAAIKAGDALEGDGWVYDAAGLTFAERAKEETYPREDITAADIVEGKVCVWVKGEAKPVVRVPAGSANALVLIRLLQKQLEGREEKEEDAGDSLGRIIFERDKSVSTTLLVVLGVIFVLCVLGGFAAAAGAVAANFPAGLVIFAAAMILLPPGIWLAVWFNRTNVFRCHAFGVCKVSTRGEKQLRFKDVNVFTYSATRVYVNGAYSGTNVAMTFEPRSEAAGDKIIYTASIKNADEELDNLRDHVSRVIAGHMKKRLEERGEVKWTDRVRFLEDGLEVITPGGLFTEGGDRVIPYKRLAHPVIDQGYFFLFEKGKKKSSYETPVSSPNFFPGYFLLMTILFPPAPKDADEDDIPTVEPAREDD